jgi:ABC-type Mn2+/Zn2+ transport system permease subunit
MRKNARVGILLCMIGAVIFFVSLYFYLPIAFYMDSASYDRLEGLPVEAYNIYYFSIVGFFLTAIFEISGFVLALRSKPSTGDKDKTG